MPARVVSVADGYARNFLLPRELAMHITANNLQHIEAEKRRRTARELERLQELKEMSDRIDGMSLTIEARASGEHGTLYGGISPAQIAQTMAKKQAVVEPQHIVVETPIKTLGVYRIKVHLHAEAEAVVKLWVVQE